MPSIRLVDRRHVQLADPEEFLLAQVLERHGALHGEVRRVDLQDQARLVDGEVLGPHLARERHQVVFMAPVVGVHHGGGDDAGRRRGGERLGEGRACRRGARLEAGDLRLDVLGVEIAHLGDRLRGVGDLGSPGEAAQEHLDQLRHLLEVLADLALGFAAEARHARGDVGLEADPLLLAVVADVDAGRQLGLDRAAHGLVHLRRHGLGSIASPASRRIRRSVSTALRGRLPTWVVRIRSRLCSMNAPLQAWKSERAARDPWPRTPVAALPL